MSLNYNLSLMQLCSPLFGLFQFVPSFVWSAKILENNLKKMSDCCVCYWALSLFAYSTAVMVG